MAQTRDEKLKAIEESLKQAQTTFAGIQQKIATEGVTGVKGRVLIPPAPPVVAPPALVAPPITPTPITPTPTEPTAADKTLQALQDWLTKQEDITTSERTSLETFLEGQRAEIARTREELPEIIGRPFERVVAETREAAQRRIEAEATRGFATNQAFISQIEEDKEKTIADLRQRQADAIKLGDIGLASDLRQMEFQTMQFAQQQKNQAFSNMLAVTGVGLQVQQFQAQQQQAEFNRISQALNFATKQVLTDEQRTQMEQTFGIPEGTLKDVSPETTFQYMPNIGLVKMESGKDPTVAISITDIPVAQQTVDTWVKLIQAGQADISNIPDEATRNKVVASFADLIPDPTNPKWVDKIIAEERALARPDGDTRTKLRGLGVPEEILNEKLPLPTVKTAAEEMTERRETAKEAKKEAERLGLPGYIDEFGNFVPLE